MVYVGCTSRRVKTCDHVFAGKSCLELPGKYYEGAVYVAIRTHHGPKISYIPVCSPTIFGYDSLCPSGIVVTGYSSGSETDG